MHCSHNRTNNGNTNACAIDGSTDYSSSNISAYDGRTQRCQFRCRKYLEIISELLCFC